MLLVFELTPEQSKTISQYITTSLITKQAKLQQNKIKEFFSLLSSYMISARHRGSSSDLTFATQSSLLCSISATSSTSSPITWHYIRACDVTLTADTVAWSCTDDRQLNGVSLFWSWRPLAVQEGTYYVQGAFRAWDLCPAVLGDRHLNTFLSCCWTRDRERAC